jgi:hypothetical protein
MSDKKIDKDFWDRADAIIGIANEQSSRVPASEVSASLIYAAARFTSFTVASMSTDIENLKKDKQKAVAYFSKQYRKMLVANIDDYIDNYNEYIEKARNT